jgi:hypothetical protein
LHQFHSHQAEGHMKNLLFEVVAKEAIKGGTAIKDGM